MEKKVTVYYKGDGLSLYKVIADKHKLKNGSKIHTLEKLKKIVYENSKHGIMLCNMMLDITQNQNN